QHEEGPDAERESRLDELHDHLRRDRDWVRRLVRRAARLGLVQEVGAQLCLTPAGRERARQAVTPGAGADAPPPFSR
ncbi:MAG: hypothetical protein NZ700_01560, partial [Gemmataceae bacterium]|nr:hypothetical protein [Gemmataceae bacterium]MDW8267356.1 hypothetical protein [Gemmataceae bacterium]